MLRLFTKILLAFFICTPLFGATINWTNTAGGNWSTAANWNPNQLPGVTDVAVIAAAGTYTVTNTVARTVAGLTVGGGGSAPTLTSSASLTVTNGTLIAGGAAFTFSAGTLGGSNTITVEGAMRWTGGAIASGMSVTVASNATLTLDGTSDKTLSGVLTNYGTLTWTNTGDFGIVGIAHNASNAVFEVNSDGFLNFTTGSPFVVNEGLIRKRFATGQNANQIPIVNRGTVDIQSGTFAYAAGSSFENGSQLTGNGTNLVSAAVTFSGNIYAENLLVTAGIHSGTSVFTGLMRWYAGTFGAASSVTINTNSQLVLAGAGTKTVSGLVTNYGTLTWTNTGDFGIVGVVHNATNAVLEVNSDGLLDFTSGSPVLVNEGLIRKRFTSGQNANQIPIVNRGTVNVQTGAFPYSAGSIFENGSQLTGAGTNLANASVTFNGTIYAENLVLTAGTYSGTSVFSGLVRWYGGAFGASSAVTIATNSQLVLDGTFAKAVSGVLTNHGTLTWTNTGAFEIVGVVHNASNALLEVHTDSFLNFLSGSPVLVNEGVIRKRFATGQNANQIPIVNRGTVDIQSGTFVYASGSSFENGSLLTGAGTNLFSSGTMTFNGQVLSDNLLLNGATITGSGSFIGSLDWLAGTLSATLDLTVPTNGVLHLAGASAKTISGAVTNAGLIRWEGTGRFAIVGRLHNLASGTIDAQSDALLDYVSGTPIFINEGVFKKTGGVGIKSSQIFVRNSGTLEVNSGTFDLQAGMTNIAGRVKLGGALLKLPSSATLRLNGGRFEGFGSLLANVHNDGFVSPAGSNGVLAISGSYTQAPAGVFEVELSGLIAGSNHSRLIVTNRAVLDGSLTVRLGDGFTPAVSNVFAVLSASPVNGDFCCRNGFFLLGQNQRFVEEFTPGLLSLRAISAADPVGVTLTLAHPESPFVLCWPYESTGYRLQSSTNLALTNWSNVALTGSNVAITPNNRPQQYFRLVSP